MKNLLLTLLIAFSITSFGQINPTTLKATIDTDVTNKTAGTVTRAAMGADMKSIVDYATQVGMVKTVKVSLTSSDILSLYTTPITIVPAVTGKLLIFKGVYQKYTYGTTTYNNVNTTRIGYGDINTGYVSIGLLLYTSTDNNGISTPFMNTASTTNYAGLPLVLGQTVGNPTDGDGTLDLYVVYEEVKI